MERLPWSRLIFCGSSLFPGVRVYQKVFRAQSGPETSFVQKMDGQKWFEIHFVALVILFFLLVIAVPIYGSDANLSDSALILAPFIISATVVCTIGIGYVRMRGSHLVLFALFPVTAIVHLAVICVMIKEFTEDDCSGHVFAVCADGESHFFTVILIDLLVHLFFALEYRMIWNWKTELQMKDRERRIAVYDAALNGQDGFGATPDMDSDPSDTGNDIDVENI
jgi:hypothetical protein